MGSMIFCGLLAVSMQLGPSPVSMFERAIGPPTPIVGGRTVTISSGGISGVLFIPDEYNAKQKMSLWVHFHTSAWFVVSEFQRARCSEPILVLDLGQGSSTYAKPFANTKVFETLLSEVAKQFEKDLEPVQIDKLNFTSFSAGYGAVRELIADSTVLDRLDTVILADSIYGSLDPANSAGRIILESHVTCWRPLVDRAIEGKTTLIMTTSQITPPTYAGTWEVAKALVENTGGKMEEVLQGSSPASSVEGQRLLRTYSKNRWFLWSYDGETPMAHMTHPRHLSDLILESRK